MHFIVNQNIYIYIYIYGIDSLVCVGRKQNESNLINMVYTFMILSNWENLKINSI